MLKDKERPPQWDVCNLFPGKSNSEIGELVADNFSAISSEFSPLKATVDDRLCDKWNLELHEVSDMLRSIKKPKSRVDGDIYPDLVSDLVDVIAVPLHTIFNRVLHSGEWLAR